jgi:2-hydroxy-6-oxonona-2,4-dienedioate hydrolase
MSHVLMPTRPRGHRAARKLVSTYAVVSGLRVHTRRSLASAAAPIVLIHGLGMSCRYLEPTARRLAATHDVFVPDMPGYGRSDHPRRALNIPELADAVAAWMHVAGPDRATFVGNSLGCQVIVDLAVRYPDLVDRAVLVGATVDPTARSFWRQVGRGFIDLPHEPMSLVPVVTLDYFIAGPIRVAQTLAYAIEDDVAGKLPLLDMPVLVVRGGLDPICPQRWAEEMTRRLPRGQLVVLPGAAHAANFGAPDALVDAIQTFLESSR